MKNYKQHKYAVEIQHLLDAIDSVGFEDCEYFNDCSTDELKAKFSYERFMSEYGWRVEQAGLQTAVIDWLQGLALSIAFSYVDIIELATKSGSLNEQSTDRQVDRICENYFPFMAMRLLSIWKMHKVM